VNTSDRVLICGGGIGGLSLALSLHAAGFSDVEVFEASSEVRELGVGINLLPHAVRELTELGLADAVATAGLETGELALYNKHGQRIWAEPRGLAAGYRWPQYSIHRGRLLGLLHGAFLDRLGAERYHLGHRVVRVDDTGLGVVVRLQDGTSAEGAVAVGVDGIHSAVRAQLYPDEGPVLWNGQTLWRGTVWAPPFLTGRSMVVVGHFGKRVVAYPISEPRADGLVLTNVVFEAQTAAGRPMPRQDWDHTADPDDARTRFETFRFDWLDLAALIDAAPVWWQYPMADRDPLPRWSFGRVTLMGDAAHPMYPVGSNGASQAIIDARTLARSLALEPTPEAGFAAYEDVRRPATAAIVLSNRKVQSELCMELAEERAPDGFDDVNDVFAPGELESIATEFKRLAGFDPAILNERPSLSVEPQS
jgi:2-polyprenyl-6-methoxyphenol hydroxylase-like FAD-dependent oxidoreductase